MRMYDLIVKKRMNQELSTEEINYFVEEYTKGNIPDYQVSALLMAIFFQKMNKRETVDLTNAMMHSGDVIDLSAIEGVKVDKHSTGGVGDTTTLILAPLVASCGVPVAKMSGRGLGHTGGTIDKLEAIKGFNTEIEIDEFIKNVNEHKVCVIGQTKDVAPADKKLYALRDVTGTVDNISLIASSIMSKKLAAGSNAIVLDVKVGSGAFIKNLDDGIKLGQAMVDIGEGMDRDTIAILTDMEQPLGYAVGNALEVKEAIATLQGNGPEDLTDLCVELASNMLLVGKKASTYEEAKKMVLSKIDSGEAFNKFKEFIVSQGGDVNVIEDTQLMADAETVVELTSDEEVYVQAIKSDDVGVSAMMLGAGRENMDSVIDMGAGIMIHKKVGDVVKAGEAYATLYTNKTEYAKAKEKLEKAFTFTKEKVEKRKLIRAVIRDGKVNKY